jgi:hypothetical protein
VVQTSGFEYRFMPDRPLINPDPAAEALRDRLVGLGYKPLEVKPVYGGHDMVQGINVSSDRPIDQQHLQTLEISGFPLAKKEKSMKLGAAPSICQVSSLKIFIFLFLRLQRQAQLP